MRIGATVKDIAQAAGVGRSTVMRALSNKGDVSPETRERILQLAKEMKYRPNHIARSLVTGRSRLVGVMIAPGLVEMQWLQTIEQRLRQAGYFVLFATSTGLPGGDRACVEQLLHNRVAAVVAVPSTIPDDPEVYRELIDSGVKLVMIGNCAEGLEALQVLGNDFQTTQLSTDYLISLGHRNIVYLAIPPNSFSGRERRRGFVETMRARGIEITDSSVVDTSFGPEAGRAAMAEILKRDDPPTAIVARHDFTAIGAMRAIYAAGMRVPDDISIIGNTDVWYNDVLGPALTSVKHPSDRIVDIGLTALLNMLSHVPVEPATIALDVQLVVRSSCAPPRTEENF